MTLVLDAQGLTMLSGNRARLEELRRRDLWPPIVPSVVLTEALTGDHRRDHHENRILRTCDIVPSDELIARAASTLRTRAGLRRAPSAVDAIVVVTADQAGGGSVLTGDPSDLRALAVSTANPVTICPA